MSKALLMLALVLSLAPLGQARAASPEALWQAADQEYFEGRPAGAFQIYGSLLDSGVLDNGALHFNLGTAALAMGRFGEAIYHLEKALRFEVPADLEAAARENLLMAKGAARAAKARELERGLVSFDESHGLAYAVFTTLPRPLVLVVFAAILGFFCLALGALGLRRLAALHGALRLLVLSLLLPVLVAGLLAGGRIWADDAVRLGIVVTREAWLLESPNPASPRRPLPEGLELRLVEPPARNYGFWKVRLPSGRDAFVTPETLREL
jgi:tetratricopeptide (TPR) repeat protein